MKALSIRQPWAWAICCLPDEFQKDIENRTWNTKYRGEFLIHASKTFDKAGHERMCRYLKSINYKGYIPEKNDFTYGAIVGKAVLTDVVTSSKSIWFEGPFGFVIKSAQPVKTPIYCKGKLGFFEPEF